MFQKSSQTRTLGGHVNIMLVQSPVRLVSLHMRIVLIKPSATDLGTNMSDPTFGHARRKTFINHGPQQITPTLLANKFYEELAIQRKPLSIRYGSSDVIYHACASQSE